MLFQETCPTAHILRPEKETSCHVGTADELLLWAGPKIAYDAMLMISLMAE